MHTSPLKLVTIIAEPVLESRITDELRSLGATGFSVVDGRGEGSRGLHATAVPGVNVRIEVLVPEPVCARIVEHLAATYFTSYAVIAYVSEVAVVRGEKYLNPTKEQR
jgi:nitrogen regulatory protein P-II 2